MEAASSWEAAELLGGVPSAASAGRGAERGMDLGQMLERPWDSHFFLFLLVDLWIVLATCLAGTAVYRCYGGK